MWVLIQWYLCWITVAEYCYFSPLVTTNMPFYGGAEISRHGRPILGEGGVLILAV